MGDLVSISQWAASGLAALQLGGRGADGSFIGFAKLDPAADAGTGSGMRRLKGAITAPFALPEPRITSVRGDNHTIARFQHEADQANNFTIENGITDLVAEAFMQTSSVYALGGWDIGARGGVLPNLQDAMLLLTRDAQSMEDDSSTASGYENLLIPSLTGSPRGDTQFADSAAGSSRYSCTANDVTVMPWGPSVRTLFGQSAKTLFTWVTEYPVTMYAFIADGTATSLTLPYTPISVAKTHVFRFDTAAELTVTGVTPSTKNVALGTALSALDDKLVICIAEVSDLL